MMSAGRFFLLLSLICIAASQKFYADSSLTDEGSIDCGLDRSKPCRTIGETVKTLLRVAVPGSLATISLASGRFHGGGLPSTIIISPDPDQPTLTSIKPGNDGGSFTIRGLHNTSVRFESVTFFDYDHDVLFNVEDKSRLVLDHVRITTTPRGINLTSGSHLHAEDSTFEGQVFQNESWAAHASSSSSIHLVNSVIQTYTTPSPVLLATDNSILRMKGCQILNVTNTNHTSPMVVTSLRQPSLQIQDSTISGCISSHDGGALYMKGGSGSISNSQFIRNTAGGSGGSMHIYRSNITMDNFHMEDNQSTKGGGLSLLDTEATIDNGTFVENRASESGGGIWIHTETMTVELMSCQFNGNDAPKGSQISAPQLGDRIHWTKIVIEGTPDEAIDCEGSSVCHPCITQCHLCEGACVTATNGTFCYLSKGFECGEHGRCKVDDITGILCECDDGWQGAYCEIGNEGHPQLLLAMAIIMFVILLGVTVSAMVYLVHRYRTLQHPELQPLLKTPSEPILNEVEKQ
ncbi:hypothetical protein PROFUN_13424 [Planoprotostelium fungivorum]|uniref:EGF-like domain-containing protein n=1 Tax=Planoprotostelium fungivorum TaxID=1890364 RepID=A0A2P6N3Z6_9EUKA|nr:hypothetical protein PROFUN_13424 [Planoprotostelium fungivorum]